MTSRDPPVQTGPPPYAIVNRLYRYNLRPVVIAISGIGAVWALFSAIGLFRGSTVHNDQNFPKLATIAIALGALYAAMCAFEAFGLFAAVSQRLPLIRIYAFLSIVNALIVLASELTQVVIHFTMKNDIITECENLATNQTIAIYPFGFWGPIHHEIIDHDDAVAWCTGNWNHDSWADIVQLLIIMFFAAIATLVAWSYYRQMLDPTSAANFTRTPVNRFYNPPYNASIPNLGYGYNMPYRGGAPPDQYQYPAPTGPPPTQNAEYKAPDYLSQRTDEGYKADDPFADFDGPSRRDVTSRPTPGG